MKINKLFVLLITISILLIIICYINSTNKKASAKSAFEIPENAVVTMNIKPLSYGTLAVTNKLCNKLRHTLKLINIKKKNTDYSGSKEIKITLNDGNIKSYLYFDRDFMNVSSGNGIWYGLSEKKNKFLIDRVLINKKYVYDSVKSIVIQEKHFDLDKDGKKEDIKIDFDGNFHLKVDNKSYRFTEYSNYYYMPMYCIHYNPIFYNFSECIYKIKFMVVTLEDTKQHGIITCFYQPMKYKGVNESEGYNTFDQLNIFTYMNKKIQCTRKDARDHLIGDNINSYIKNNKIILNVPSANYSTILPLSKEKLHPEMYQEYLNIINDRKNYGNPYFYFYLAGDTTFIDTDGDGLKEVCSGAPLIYSSFPECGNCVGYCDLQFDVTSKGLKLKHCKILFPNIQ